MDKPTYPYRELVSAASPTTQYSSEDLEARLLQNLAALADIEQLLEREREKRQQAEERARQHLQHLAHIARVATLSERTAALAHELNQPLGAISHYAWGGLERFRQGRADLETLGGALERIAAQTERAGRIIRHLRSFLSRREAELTRVDVNQLLRDVAILERTLHQEVDFRLELDGELPLVLADDVQIQQVVLNLMINGTKAMQPLAPENRELLLRSRFESAVTVPPVLLGDLVEAVLDGANPSAPGRLRGAQAALRGRYFSTSPVGRPLFRAASRGLTFDSSSLAFVVEPSWTPVGRGRSLTPLQVLRRPNDPDTIPPSCGAPWAALLSIGSRRAPGRHPPLTLLTHGGARPNTSSADAGPAPFTLLLPYVPAWLFLVRNSPRLQESVFAMMTAPSNDVLHRLLKLSNDTAELVAEFSEMTRAAQERAGEVSIFLKRRSP